MLLSMTLFLFLQRRRNPHSLYREWGFCLFENNIRSITYNYDCLCDISSLRIHHTISILERCLYIIYKRNYEIDDKEDTSINSLYAGYVS